MKRTNTEHVRAEEGGRLLKCHHCGDSYVVTLPVLIDIYVATTKAYVKAHRHCKQRETACSPAKN